MSNVIVVDMVIGKQGDDELTEPDVKSLLADFLAWVEEHELEAAGSWALADCGHDHGGLVPGFDQTAKQIHIA